MATSWGGVATRVSVRIIAGVILCAAIGVGIVVFMAGSRSSRATAESSRATADAPRKVAASLEVSTLDPLSLIATFPDPNAPGTSKGVFLDSVRFDTGVSSTAAEFTGARRDEGSLEEFSQSILSRYRRGMATWRERADRLSVDTAAGGEQAIEAIQIWRNSPSSRCTRGIRQGHALARASAGGEPSARRTGDGQSLRAHPVGDRRTPPR